MEKENYDWPDEDQDNEWGYDDYEGSQIPLNEASSQSTGLIGGVQFEYS